MNPIIVAQYTTDFMAVVAQYAMNDPEYQELQAKLNSRKVILGPASIYAAKLIGGNSSVKIIDPSVNDKRDIGLRNFDQAKLDKDVYLMITSVQIRATTSGSLTENQLKTIKYDSISDVGAAPNDGILQNGEINFNFGTMQLFRNFPLSNFVTDGNGNVNIGEYHLPLRRIIKPQTDFQLELKAPSGANFPADYGVRVDIKGIWTMINS